MIDEQGLDLGLLIGGQVKFPRQALQHSVGVHLVRTARSRPLILRRWCVVLRDCGCGDGERNERAQSEREELVFHEMIFPPIFLDRLRRNSATMSFRRSSS